MLFNKLLENTTVGRKNMSRCKGYDAIGTQCQQKFWLSLEGYCPDHNQNRSAGKFDVDFSTLPGKSQDSIVRELNSPKTPVTPKSPASPKYPQPVRRQLIQLSTIESLETEVKARIFARG
jgi:hypothetical protein